MPRRKPDQMQLPLHDGGLWSRVPQERRARCRELLRQMLQKIVTTEVTTEGASGERQDPAQSS